MAIDVEERGELVRVSAAVEDGRHQVITIVYIDAATAIEAGQRMMRAGERILCERATRLEARRG